MDLTKQKQSILDSSENEPSDSEADEVDEIESSQKSVDAKMAAEENTPKSDEIVTKFFLKNHLRLLEVPKRGRFLKLLMTMVRRKLTALLIELFWKKSGWPWMAVTKRMPSVLRHTLKL